MTRALKGRRLALRPLAEGDAPELYEAVASSAEALRRRLRWAQAVRSAEDCLAFIRRSLDEERGGLGTTYGVFESRARRLVGVCALRANGGPAELSGWIRSDRAGKGYGEEAGRVLAARGFRGGAHKLYARIEPANRAGRRVLQKLGFRYEGCLRRDRRLNGRWVDQECWGLLKGEWRK